MRKVIVSMMTTLDGFIEGPNRELDWPTEHPDFDRYLDAMMAATDLMLFGRVSYEMMVKYWPAAEEKPARPHEGELAKIMNRTAKIVFSRTLREAAWRNTRIAADAAGEVPKLKQAPGKNIMVFGGAGIISSLTRARLVDEYRLIVYPHVLGAGRPLFQRVNEFALAHIGTETFENGAVLLRYEPRDARR